MTELKQKADYGRVKQAVAALQAEYGLDRPPIDPVLIARDRGLDVRFVPFSGAFKDASGFYDPRDQAIYVNRAESPLRQTFTIAHELGHSILHQDWSKSDEYKIFWRDVDRNNKEDPHEKEANTFAADLLVPRKMLDSFRQDLSVHELSRLFAVSVSMINNRLAYEYGI